MVFSLIYAVLFSYIFPSELTISNIKFVNSDQVLEGTFLIDNRERKYLLHLPERINKNAPLVFVLHGYGGSASSIMSYTKMNDIANKNGFAVCYPQAFLGSDDKHSWNAGYSNFEVDDVNFLSSLASYLHKKHSLSPLNTFSTGMSNGADMSYVLACQNPELFRAVAPIAGCMMESTYADCNQVKPVSIFHVHGTDDDITYWGGDKEYLPGSGGYRSTIHSVNYWSNKNGSTIVLRDTIDHINTTNKSIVVREKRLNPITGRRNWLYTIKGGKHDWPGANGNHDFNASQEIWDFFKGELIKSKRTNIVFFGSSVCKGSGAIDTKGYAYQFYHGKTIDSILFKYNNASTGGDNTLKVEQEERLTKKLYPSDPDFVVIGLSLANEGIRRPKSQDGRSRIVEQFRSRLLTLADSLQFLGIQPIIANCYPHSQFTEDQYRSTKKMNQIINTWKYPSINLLGSIDDGSGKWVKGYDKDPGHPNTKGHHEMSLAIVPSLFEALLLGKKTPKYDHNKSHVHLTNTLKKDAITYPVKETIHSFTMSFKFRKSSNGILAKIETGNGSRTVKIADQKIYYQSHEVKIHQDSNQWNQIVISHNYANQKTLLAINGIVKAVENEKLAPTRFTYGGDVRNIELKDLMLHRSSINEDEIRDLNNNLLIQSSLEIYTPLTSEVNGKYLPNKAQSLSQLSIDKNIEIEFVKTPYYKRK